MYLTYCILWLEANAERQICAVCRTALYRLASEKSLRFIRNYVIFCESLQLFTLDVHLYGWRVPNFVLHQKIEIFAK